MSLSSLQLLPQSPKTQIPNHLKYSKVLQIVKFFTQQTIKALEAFYIKEHFHEFDPHVGENACQIRAYHIALLANTINDDVKHIVCKKLTLLKSLIDNIEKDLPYYQNIDTSKQKNRGQFQSLEQFIIENQYHFEINEIEFFLIQARILTKYKLNNNQNICYASLTKDMCVSKNTARQLVHLYQVNLSAISCDFILSLVDQLPSPMYTRNEFKLLKHFDDDGRSVLPCFWTMKAIYSHLLYSEKAIILAIKRIHNEKVIDEFILPLSPFKHYKDFISDEWPLIQSNESCFIIRGITTYSHAEIETRQAFITRLLSIGIEKIFLSNAAIHPQFSGKKLFSLSANPLPDNLDFSNVSSLGGEFLAIRKTADSLGCSIRSPFLFYITHMYCDKFKRLQNAFTETQIESTTQYLNDEKQYV